MRKNRRLNKRSRVTDVYYMLEKNLNQNWIACILSGLVFIPHMFFGIKSGFTFISGIITFFTGLIFVQSIRAIIRLNYLKKMLLSNPHSVTEKQINSAPNIKSFFWIP